MQYTKRNIRNKTKHLETGNEIFFYAIYQDQANNKPKAHEMGNLNRD